MSKQENQPTGVRDFWPELFHRIETCHRLFARFIDYSQAKGTNNFDLLEEIECLYRCIVQHGLFQQSYADIAREAPCFAQKVRLKNLVGTLADGVCWWRDELQREFKHPLQHGNQCPLWNSQGTELFRDWSCLKDNSNWFAFHYFNWESKMPYTILVGNQWTDENRMIASIYRISEFALFRLVFRPATRKGIYRFARANREGNETQCGRCSLSDWDTTLSLSGKFCEKLNLQWIKSKSNLEEAAGKSLGHCLYKWFRKCFEKFKENPQVRERMQNNFQKELEQKIKGAYQSLHNNCRSALDEYADALNKLFRCYGVLQEAEQVFTDPNKKGCEALTFFSLLHLWGWENLYFFPIVSYERTIGGMSVSRSQELEPSEEVYLDNLVKSIFVPLVTLEREEQIRRSVLKSAVAAIMARNMSHIHGSHIEPGLQHKMLSFEREIIGRLKGD
ncbi:MAG: hypothetical protein J7K33_11285 [Candidatus Marinimicrobia bacterium]|nr:hypothetical protein [Candidatus Neomarinimicrobiota bacterium]